MCQRTCYEELSPDADTSQSISGGGEVSSISPCRRAPGPGLGGGDLTIVIAISSTDNVNLNSECYNTVVQYDG